jgi:pyruvate/2-oxoglutarate dehydrogenase complex dihydrolipoamide acyltransferase (E2) component
MRRLRPPKYMRIDRHPSAPLTEHVPVTRAERTSWAMNDVLTPGYMVTMVSEVDATAMEALRQRARGEGELAPSYTALVIKAAALTMRRNPHANRAILGPPFFRRLVQFRNADIGVAVEKSLPALPGQAFAAPIRDAADRPLAEITAELQELAACDEHSDARYRLFMRILKRVPRPLSLWLINAPYWSPKLWSEHRGCACWVNAPSRAGADLVMTTWPWPITFSFGVVRRRAIAVGEELQARTTMPLVMVFDRRIMGGGPAGRVFADFKTILETAAFGS